MMRVVLALGGLILASCTQASTEPRRSGSVDLADCNLPRVEARTLCGTFEVRENPAVAAGRRIPLRIVVIPAQRGGGSPDPVFYFDGGPGSSATGAAGWVSRLLRAVNDSRDLVFVDVRGTGGSSPLHCPAPADDEPLQRWFDEFLSDDYVRRCLAAQQADVRFYTQPIAMDDIEAVRSALGYGQINLYGTSGGTRQAQLYMRRYAASVRSAVLQGVTAMDAEVPSSFGRAMERAIHALTDRDPALADAWRRAVARVSAGPVRATVRDAQSGRVEEVTITRGVFADGVRHMLYNLNAAGRFAAVIHSAAGGDFGPFAQAELESARSFSRGIAHGFLMSATCAEDVRFIDEDDVRRAAEGTLLGEYRIRRQQAACRIWPSGEGITADFQQPVRVEVPVLVMSGDLDVATPAEDAARVVAYLPKARHVIFPNQGHALRDPACASRLMAEFIASADASRLDTTCAGATRSN